MIQHLETWQERALVQFRERALKAGLSTEPANRPQAEKGLRKAYRASGFEPPKVILWARSPQEGCLWGALLKQLSDQSGDPLSGQLGEHLRGQLSDQLWNQLWGQLWGQLSDLLSGQLRGQLFEQLSRQLFEQLSRQVRDQLFGQFGDDQLFGQFGDQLKGQLSGHLRGQLSDQLGEQFGEQLGEQLWEQLSGQLWGQLWNQLWGQLSIQLSDQFGDQLWGQLRGQIIRGQLGDQLWGQLWNQLWGQLSRQLWNQLSEQLSRQVRKQLSDQFGYPLKEQLWNQLGEQLWSQLEEQLFDQLWGHLWGQLSEQLRGQLWGHLQSMLYHACYGHHDLHWLTHWQYVRLFLPTMYDGPSPDGAIQVAMNSGWWWPYEKIAIMSERPHTLKRDPEGRLHCEDGPAVQYPDGWGVWSWHGTRIPSEWIEDPTSLTPETALAWENIEQRRAAVEILGWERVLSALDCRTIDEDPDPMIGTLLECDLPDAPEEKFLKVLCGTGRTFVLPVPREMVTARQANAWTYGLEPGELQLEART